MSNPKVFISHAHEDKERFVTDFALKLRENGVDAWYDQWEMAPGDSLVNKIFEEGIKDCDSFLIVLSENSIKKRWVKEELDSAVVQRIERSTKLIPIVIDSDIEIPVSIKHLLRTEINDTDNYDEELKNLLMTLFGVSDKPALGEKPPYAIDYQLPGYTKSDAIILKNIGDLIIKKNDFEEKIQVKDLIKRIYKFSLNNEQIEESLEILNQTGLIFIETTFDPINEHEIQLTSLGFMTYAENFMENFPEMQNKVISAIYKDKLKRDTEISAKTKIPRYTISMLLETYNDLNYLILDNGHTGGLMIEIDEITAEGNRFFRGELS